MKTLQTLQELREAKREIELRRDSEKNKIKSTVDGFKTIYPWISIGIKMYQTFHQKKDTAKNEKKNLFEKIRAWAMNIVQAYTQFR
jgi:hypothetical protein